MAARILGFFPANGSTLLVPLLLVFGTVGTTLSIACDIIVTSMLADVVEDSQIKTGRRSEGVFFAGSSFMQKTASGLGLLGSGLILSLAHFPTNAVPGKVAPAVLQSFAGTYLAGILIVYGIAAVLLHRFPITRASHEEHLKRLANETAALAGEPLAPRG